MSSLISSSGPKKPANILFYFLFVVVHFFSTLQWEFILKNLLFLCVGIYFEYVNYISCWSNEKRVRICSSVNATGFSPHRVLWTRWFIVIGYIQHLFRLFLKIEKENEVLAQNFLVHWGVAVSNHNNYNINVQTETFDDELKGDNLAGNLFWCNYPPPL